MHRFVFLLLFSLLCGAQIQLDQEVVTVEIADTPAARARGLMGRRNLADGHGMLFVYSKPEKLSFWMKNTLIPLSIAFFDAEKTLIHLLDMDPCEKNWPIYQSCDEALYALEVPQGWFAKQGIEPGAKFSFLDPENGVR